MHLGSASPLQLVLSKVSCLNLPPCRLLKTAISLQTEPKIRIRLASSLITTSILDFILEYVYLCGMAAQIKGAGGNGSAAGRSRIYRGL